MEEPISYATRRKHWLGYPEEERQQMLCGILDYLLETEEVSLEQSIQRCIDTFGCKHDEVMEALRVYGRRK